MTGLARLRAGGVAAAITLATLAAVPPARASQASAQLPVEELVLDNGMKFLLVPRPEQTTVMGGWVAHVGSANERPGITGVAHFFEHMMFKGTRAIGTKDAVRDAEIIAEQEAMQEQIRALYARAARALSPGRDRRPVRSRPPGPRRWSSSRRRFQALVEEQRDLMVKDEFDKIYTEAGASGMNATTNWDSTVYFDHGSGQQARALVLDGVGAAAAAGLSRVLLRARRGAGGAPTARRVDADRAVRRTAERDVLDVASVQVGHDRLDERSQDALDGRRPGLLLDLLRAQQHHRRAGRQLRRRGGPATRRDVLRAHPARQEAGARRRHARGAAARRKADERRVRLPAAGLDPVPHDALPAPGQLRLSTSFEGCSTARPAG